MEKYLRVMIVSVLIIVFLLLMIYFLFFTGINELNYENSNDNDQVFDTQSDNDGNIQENNSSPMGEALSIGSDGGGGSVTSGGSATCNQVQISYALKNLNVTQNCNEYEGEVCTSKTVICGLEVHNLDNQAGGEFEVNFSFFDPSNFYLGSYIEGAYVNAGSYELISGNILIDGEFANREIRCSFKTIKVPRKSICL